MLARCIGIHDPTTSWSLPARFLEHNAKTSPQSGTCHPLTLSRLPQLNGQDSITNALVCKINISNIQFHCRCCTT